jgi:hypothetical protein
MSYFDRTKITDGTNVMSITTDGQANVADSDLETARGARTGKKSVNKFGRAIDGIQTTATDIWDRADATPTQQIWTAPTQARTHTIASTDANDTDGGTGARTVEIYGLTGWDAAEVTETVTMDTGTPPVTSNSYVIIHRMEVLTTGTGGKNAGTITATATTDATVTAQINIGQGQTQMCIFGIPSTQKGYLNNYYAAMLKLGAAGNVDVSLLVNPEPDVQLAHFNVKHTLGVQSTGSSYFNHEFGYDYEIVGPAIIKLQGIGSAADLDTSAGFDIVLIDN